MSPDGTLRFVSPSSMDLLGHPADALIDEPSRLTETVVPEDRAVWNAAHALAFNRRQATSVEVRMVTAAGATRCLDVALTPIRDDRGVYRDVRGAGRDITERKRSELELQSALDEIGRLRDRLETDVPPAEPAGSTEEPLPGVLGTSDAMEYVTARVRTVAPTASTVLLLGETGSGKSQLARAIHDLSPRWQKPLVTLNCAVLPASLVESELFGHEKGAFTGAHQRRLGRFESADQGTLFLDEIAELPIELQGKLLRAVQDGEFERVGGSTTIRVDVRLIAATNANVENRIRMGQFRQDLWYRINVFPITVPPLRKRQEDIPQLALAFVARHCERLDRPMLEVSRATMKWLQAQPWPGNVRELESFIERSVIQSRGTRLVLDHGDALGQDGADIDDPPARHGVPVTLKDSERQLIVETLETTAWRVHGRGGAADRLGINPSTLRSRMRKLGIERPSRVI
jgi:PAS domain S-box-containing protein